MIYIFLFLRVGGMGMMDGLVVTRAYIQLLFSFQRRFKRKKVESRKKKETEGGPVWVRMRQGDR